MPRISRQEDEVMRDEGHEGRGRAGRDAFRRFSMRAATTVGTSWAFVAAVVVVLGWAVTGPLFGFSEGWQLVINTGTTIITFLMVFLIQNAQNRDSKAIQLKLDELIRSVSGARNQLVDLEDCTDEELEVLQTEFRRLRQKMIADRERPAR
jgi:low affinity Fe/Cu permease